LKSTFPYLLTTSLIFISPLGFANNEDDESPKIIDELFLSNTAYPPEEGKWGIIASPRYEKGDEGEQFSIPLSIEYGLTDQLKVEFEYTPYIHVDSNEDGNLSGNGNIGIGFKYVWANINDFGLNIAVGYEHEFASGDSDVISDGDDKPKDENSVYIAFAKNINSEGTTQALIQLGSEFQDSEKEEYVNLGLYSAFDSYSLSAEYNWAEEQSFITPGITWNLPDGWAIGIATPIGIDGEADYAVTSNIIYEWE
jgi:hypothetical protein